MLRAAPGHALAAAASAAFRKGGFVVLLVWGKSLSFFGGLPQLRGIANAPSCLCGFVRRRIRGFVSLKGCGFVGSSFCTESQYRASPGEAGSRCRAAHRAVLRFASGVSPLRRPSLTRSRLGTSPCRVRLGLGQVTGLACRSAHRITPVSPSRSARALARWRPGGRLRTCDGCAAPCFSAVPGNPARNSFQGEHHDCTHH